MALCYDQLGMTIDALARATGTTTRNIRAMQTEGLLPPPSLRGRVGTYDGEHVARVQAVLRLQARGFSRAAVRELLSAWEVGATLEDILGLPPRRRLRGHAPSLFDVLAESLPTWRGPRDGLLPGPLSEGVVVN
jgi:DNA-binding transcriptional MerR regulator